MKVKMEKCYGCGGNGSQNIDTWDEGDGWITYNYCIECIRALENICDRCEVAGENIHGTALCQKCIDDYNNGESY